jgi:glucuronate isomerase
VEAGGVTELHEDRYFDPDPIVRRYARALYDETRALPIVSPHGHVDPAILASDEPFTSPASLIITSDHYVLRLLYSRGVPLEWLGVEPIDGKPPNAEPNHAGSGRYSSTIGTSFVAPQPVYGSSTCYAGI